MNYIIIFIIFILLLIINRIYIKLKLRKLFVQNAKYFEIYMNDILNDLISLPYINRDVIFPHQKNIATFLSPLSEIRKRRLAQYLITNISLTQDLIKSLKINYRNKTFAYSKSEKLDKHQKILSLYLSSINTSKNLTNEIYNQLQNQNSNIINYIANRELDKEEQNIFYNNYYNDMIKFSDTIFNLVF